MNEPFHEFAGLMLITAAIGALAVRLRQPLIVHGYPPTAVSEKAREIRADLIVMGKHGQSKLEDLLVGSVSKHVLAHATCDVLVVGQVSPGAR